MADDVKTLYETPWLSLRSMEVEAAGGAEYIYVHSNPSKGLGVAVLPFRNREGHPTEFLLRKELVPPWGLDTSVCSVTGMHEGGEFIKTAQRELKEEAGYEADLERFIPVGEMRASKASDTLLHMFLVDLSGVEEGEAEGDGTAFEKLGSCYWTTDPFEAEDSTTLALIAYAMREGVCNVR